MRIIPIFSGLSGQESSWLQLPIAPQAQSRLRFSDPGKPERALTATEALDLLMQINKKVQEVEMVELSGPGDPLATPELTLNMIRLLRNHYTELGITITTLGLGIEPLIDELANLRVRPNFQLDAVKPALAEKIFTWIRPEKKTIPLTRAAPILVKSQAQAMLSCKAAKLKFSVNTTVYAGYNDDHIEEIAKIASGFGADHMILHSFISSNIENGSTEFENRQFTGSYEQITRYLPMAPVPVYISKVQDNLENGRPATPSNRPVPRKGKPYAAVLSGGGMEVDLHLGHARKALIYGPREDGLVCFLETRKLPEPGGGDQRWEQVAEILNDCFVILAASSGQKPREILGRRGLTVLISEDDIEALVDLLYGDGKKGRCKK